LNFTIFLCKDSFYLLGLYDSMRFIQYIVYYSHTYCTKLLIPQTPPEKLHTMHSCPAIPYHYHYHFTSNITHHTPPLIPSPAVPFHTPLDPSSLGVPAPPDPTSPSDPPPARVRGRNPQSCFVKWWRVAGMLCFCVGSLHFLGKWG
jgi:hypothetical protein